MAGVNEAPVAERDGDSRRGIGAEAARALLGLGPARSVEGGDADDLEAGS
jgi:hypothetical protein